jgi:hypothetical protein
MNSKIRTGDAVYLNVVEPIASSEMSGDPIQKFCIDRPTIW